MGIEGKGEKKEGGEDSRGERGEEGRRGEEEEEEGVHKKEKEYISMEEYPACRTNSAAASNLHLICTCCVGGVFQLLSCLQKLDKGERVYCRVGCPTKTEYLPACHTK